MATQVKRKISYTVDAAWQFIESIHTEGLDRGLIATFDDTFRIRQDFTTSKASLKAALANIKPDGGTLLYDSLHKLVQAFWLAARRDCPWMCVGLTDGDDNRSKDFPFNHPASPELIGRYIGRYFSPQHENYPYLIGVGRDGEIKKKVIDTIGHYGNFDALTIDSFPRLGDLFQRIACKVTTKLTEKEIQVGPYTFIQPTVQQELIKRGIDYAFLIDCSGSMGNAATM